MKVRAKNLNLFKNLEKEKIMLCVQYVVATLALDMVVKMASTSITQHQNTNNFLILLKIKKKKLTNWGASRATANLDKKSNKIRTTFCRLHS